MIIILLLWEVKTGEVRIHIIMMLIVIMMLIMMLVIILLLWEAKTGEVKIHIIMMLIMKLIMNIIPNHKIAGANKPARCENVPTTACAVAYDSSTCNGGWRLVIPQVSENDDLDLDDFNVDFQGEMRFRWFTATYSYRFHPLDSFIHLIVSSTL